MAPEERAAASELARLRAEIQADRDALARRVDDLRASSAAWGGAPPTREALVFAAVAVHAWYTGFEATLERVARQIDRSVPSGDASHRDLLSQAMSDVPGLRPAVVPRRLYADLVSLLGFRHFFRHAYGVEIEQAKLQSEVDRLLRIEAEVARALDAFDAFLASALASLAP